MAERVEIRQDELEDLRGFYTRAASIWTRTEDLWEWWITPESQWAEPPDMTLVHQCRDLAAYLLDSGGMAFVWHDETEHMQTVGPAVQYRIEW